MANPTYGVRGNTIQREPDLLGQTVVVIGGSAGIGLETARRARAEGAKVILTGRSPEPVQRAAVELEAAEHCGIRRYGPCFPRTLLS